MLRKSIVVAVTAAALATAFETTKAFASEHRGAGWFVASRDAIWHGGRGWQGAWRGPWRAGFGVGVGLAVAPFVYAGSPHVYAGYPYVYAGYPYAYPYYGYGGGCLRWRHVLYSGVWQWRRMWVCG
jgi:hypothetical protein